MQSCPSTLTAVLHPVLPGGWHDRAKWTGTSAPLLDQTRSSFPSHKIHLRPDNPGSPCLTLLLTGSSLLEGVDCWNEASLTVPVLLLELMPSTGDLNYNQLGRSAKLSYTLRHTFTHSLLLLLQHLDPDVILFCDLVLWSYVHMGCAKRKHFDIYKPFLCIHVKVGLSIGGL